MCIRDSLNWDATVKQDGEKTPGSHNRVTDVTNQWLYTLAQEIPAHTVELFHYKSFTITDAVDSCLSYDVKDIAIKAGDKDYTEICIRYRVYILCTYFYDLWKIKHWLYGCIVLIFCINLTWCVIGFCQEYVPKFGTHKRKKYSEKSRLEHWNSEK